MRLVIALAISSMVCAPAFARDKSIVVASTTSTRDSRLFGQILPIFKARTGIDVKVVTLGTGQALDTARRGDADLVFVHAKAAKEKFLAEGFGVKRYPVMYNDFILIGPRSDLAGIKGSKDIVSVLTIKDTHYARNETADNRWKAGLIRGQARPTKTCYLTTSAQGRPMRVDDTTAA